MRNCPKGFTGGSAQNNTGGDICCLDSPKGIGPSNCDKINVNLAFGLSSPISSIIKTGIYKSDSDDTKNKIISERIDQSMDIIDNISNYGLNFAIPKCKDTDLYIKHNDTSKESVDNDKTIKELNVKLENLNESNKITMKSTKEIELGN